MNSSTRPDRGRRRPAAPPARPVLTPLVLAVLVLAAGCTPDRDPATLFAPDGVGVPVVDAVLLVGMPLPEVRLSRTQPPDAPYDVYAALERGAVVAISKLAVDGLTVEWEQEYAWDEEALAYAPVAPYLNVAPSTTYVLRVETAAGEIITARTTTPRRIEVASWELRDDAGTTVRRELRTMDDIGDAVFDHPDNLLEYADGQLDARFGPGGAAAWGAAGFQVSLFSVDPEAGFVIDPPFFEPEDFEDLPRTGSSPILDGADGFVRLPWFSVYYDGRHIVRIYAVDRNWFDLVRTLPEAGAGFGIGGNLGDGVDPPIFHVEGGIGLFGSGSFAANGFRIKPVE